MAGDRLFLVFRILFARLSFVASVGPCGDGRDRPVKIIKTRHDARGQVPPFVYRALFRFRRRASDIRLFESRKEIVPSRSFS